MSMIRTLVPLNMYRVTYELAHGRPYSKFEELLLKAIKESTDTGGRTFRQLAETFMIHVRLLTEGLVTLIQEGWVAMEQRGSELYYLATEQGQATVEAGRRPSNLRVRMTHTNVVRERLTGQLARASELSLITANVLRRAANRAVYKEALRPRIIRTKINGGEAERLLPRSAGRQEWVRWIDSAVRVSQDLHYLAVRVDLDQDKVFGLPYQWQHLGPMIVEETRERRLEFEAEAAFQAALQRLMPSSGDSSFDAAPAVERRAEPYATASVSCNDLTLRGFAGRELAGELFARAVGSLLIVAGNLDLPAATAVKEAAIVLRRRGVHCDVLWSCADEAAVDPIQRQITAIRADDSAPGRAQFNRAPAGDVADMIITETPDGPVAAVGAGLFGGVGQDDELRPTLRLTDPAVVAAVARLCAGWWEDLPAGEGALPAHRWKHLAEKWTGEAANRPPEEPGFAPGCPGGPASECAGRATVLVGPQQAAFAASLAAEPAQRYLCTEPDQDVDRLVADAGHLPGTVGRRYRVVGGVDGWRALRREGTSWSVDVLPGPSPTPSQRLLAVGARWLVACGGPGRSSISFCVEGHVGQRAWLRTMSDFDIT
ncbi:hypothetical protein ACPPVO_44975 [Dactylosporangium sp. McL0621]|uniref:hypothetical protein n=1 Tax=Dactylosporangium sp. McL0621 TaxID=3415678 RepID=UPI003CE8A0B2